MREDNENSAIETELITVDGSIPDPAIIRCAADLLLAGKLVAFPTETVYGLGANALDSEAVQRIYIAKGRPAINPIIVHVADTSAAAGLVTHWSGLAQTLAEKFWPGPLTLVLPKSDLVPDIVTAGGSTVAIRVPSHPVALALLKACGVPVAAPSANLSMQLSPTRAEHVLKGLDGRISLILDGGPAPGGLESTVINLSVSPPILLRPGLISREEIETQIGPISLTQSALPEADSVPLPAPGMMLRHYSPRTPLVIGDWNLALNSVGAGKRTGWLTYTGFQVSHSLLTTRNMPSTPKEYAAELYSALHELDEAGLDLIVVECPGPPTPNNGGENDSPIIGGRGVTDSPIIGGWGEISSSPIIDASPVSGGWEAIRDRLNRASTLLDSEQK